MTVGRRHGGCASRQTAQVGRLRLGRFARRARARRFRRRRRATAQEGSSSAVRPVEPAGTSCDTDHGLACLDPRCGQLGRCPLRGRGGLRARTRFACVVYGDRPRVRSEHRRAGLRASTPRATAREPQLQRCQRPPAPTARHRPRPWASARRRRRRTASSSSGALRRTIRASSRTAILPEPASCAVLVPADDDRH